jgi:hypothetical protein
MFIDFVDIEEVKELVKILLSYNDNIRKLKNRKDLNVESEAKAEANAANIKLKDQVLKRLIS